MPSMPPPRWRRARIENWIDRNKVSMNCMKTNSLLFPKTFKNKSAEIKIASTLGFIAIRSVVKYLSVFFDKIFNRKLIRS